MRDETFRRPLQFVQGQDVFHNNEVGVTHPDNPGFIRLKDNGDIEIVAGEGCSIILHPAKKSITFVADSIKFLTRNGNRGLLWNQQAFNENADTFNEPTFVPVRDEDNYSLYKGVDHFLYGATADSAEAAPVMPEGLPPRLAAAWRGQSDGVAVYPNSMVKDPETGETVTYATYYEKHKKPPPFGNGVVNG